MGYLLFRNPDVQSQKRPRPRPIYPTLGALPARPSAYGHTRHEHDGHDARIGLPQQALSLGAWVLGMFWGPNVRVKEYVNSRHWTKQAFWKIAFFSKLLMVSAMDGGKWIRMWFIPGYFKAGPALPAPGQTLSATCLGPTLLGLWRSECALKHCVWKEQVLESRVVLSLLCRGVKESIEKRFLYILSWYCNCIDFVDSWATNSLELHRFTIGYLERPNDETELTSQWRGTESPTATAVLLCHSQWFFCMATEATFSTCVGPAF